MTNRSLLLRPILLFLCIVIFAGVTPPVLAKNTAVLEIFDGRLPVGYNLLRSGLLPYETGKQGYYVVMSNPTTQTMALVAETFPRDEADMKSPFNTQDLASLADHLFTEYVGLHEYKINTEREKWIRLGEGYFRIAWMRVKFGAGFEEADTILRLEYPQGRQIIVLMGKPATGSYKNCPAFRKDYYHMEAQTVSLIETCHFLNNAQANENLDWLSLYLKNLFKSRYAKNCFQPNR